MSWIIGLVVLVLAGGGGFVYWQKGKAQKASTSVSSLSPTSVPVTPEGLGRHLFSTNNLTISSITLEKAKAGSVVYAVGMVKNELDRQRFAIRVEVDLFDGDEAKVGTATDYLSILEPKKEWKFKALVLEKKAVSARLAAIKEDQ